MLSLIVRVVLKEKSLNFQTVRCSVVRFPNPLWVGGTKPSRADNSLQGLLAPSKWLVVPYLLTFLRSASMGLAHFSALSGMSV